MKNNTNTQGKFIVISGGEGSGKTTVLEHLSRKLPQVLFTREPGGSPYGEAIREVMLKHPHAKSAPSGAHFCLAWAGRVDHLENKIIPALGRGQHVISDRFDCCTYAYQICAQEGSHLEDLFWIMRSTVLNPQLPHLYIHLDVDVDEGLRRVALRKGVDQNHFDDARRDFHVRIQEGYRTFFEKMLHKKNNDTKMIKINANQPLQAVIDECERVVQEYLV